MSMNLALMDAANNCIRENATATVSLKGGVQLTGRLQRPSGADLGTMHMHTKTGWVTFLTDEVAAVESWR